MEEELSLDNIMSPDDIDSLFTGGEQESEEKASDKGKENIENNKKEEKTAEINKEELFEKTNNVSEKSESVGSGDNQEDGGTSADEKPGGSPKPNFYSSTASALKDDGVLPELEDSDIEKIKTPEDLSAAIEKQLQGKLTEKQKRIDEALQYGVQPNAVKQFEDTLEILDGISDDSLSDEGEEGEKLRKQLIYNDAINRGFSKERAMREVESSFKNGTDIEDASDALQSSKEYYSKRYNDLIGEAKAQDEKYRKELKAQADEFKKALLEDKEVFDGITLDSKTRTAAYESMTKAVSKDEEGNWLTPIQKYEHDNPLEFRKKLGVIYALTNGFKDINGLIKEPVKKKVRSKFNELERTFNSTRRSSDGSLRLADGYNDNDDSPENMYGKGFHLDM